MDFYFGEIRLLYNDVKNAKGIKTKFLYLIKPPGWNPESNLHTAGSVRENFLKENQGLELTSKNLVLKKLVSIKSLLQ
jgi:hypothetical protein